MTEGVKERKAGRGRERTWRDAGGRAKVKRSRRGGRAEEKEGRRSDLGERGRQGKRGKSAKDQ